MCTDHHDYTDFPSMTVGGPAGDYILRPPVTSNDYVEFSVVSSCNIGVQPATILVSGTLFKLPTLDTTGESTFSDKNFLASRVIFLPPNSYIPEHESYDRIAHETGNLAIKIIGATCAFVTIKMRVKVLKKIPAPFVTVQDPQDMHQMREDRIKEAVLQREGRLVEYGRQPGKAGTTIRPR